MYPYFYPQHCTLRESKRELGSKYSVSMQHPHRGNEELHISFFKLMACLCNAGLDKSFRVRDTPCNYFPHWPPIDFNVDGFEIVNREGGKKVHYLGRFCTEKPTVCHLRISSIEQG